ncbi:hypothetical protein C0993_011967 [Termitomyces sp. T159_Od127]|nr:hypothetical protein C0993_011967 [Termitomyces sp. T159_Od127]
MSISLTQKPDVSSTSVPQRNEPMLRVPMAENPFTYISTVILGQTDSAVNDQQTAPQLVEISLSSIVTRPTPSSQPPVTIVISPTSSLPSVLFDPPVPSPTTDVTSAISVSILSSVPPPTTSIVTLAAAISTAFTSPAETFSAESALGSEIPAATTVTAAVVQVPSSSPSQVANDNSVVTEGGHHAPFYIAVIVGTILAIGLIAAVIAWAVRLRMHARRRRENPIVPWANHHVEECPLEASRDAIFIGQPIDRSASKDISSQDAIPWEPCGDRDVGEPKRSNTHLRSSLRSSLVPGPVPCTEPHPYPIHAHDVASSASYYLDHTMRDTNTSSDGTLDGCSSASSLGPLQIANRTPEDTSPSLSCASTPGNMCPTHIDGTRDSEYRPRFAEPTVEGRSRLNVAPVSTKEAWEFLPLPGRTQNRGEEIIIDDSSSWTASIKSGFTDAFNAVAASLPSGAALMINREDKNLDSLPLRPTQSSARRSLFSYISRSNSSAGQPWTLEERGDGTGRVLFRDIEAEGHGLTAFKLQTDPTSIRRSSIRDSILSPVAQPPRFGRTHVRDTGLRNGRSLRQPSMRSTSSIASSSSAYSVASAVSSVPRLPALSRHSTIKLDPPMETVFERKERNVPSRHPSRRPAALVARSSSSGCSVHSYYYGEDATCGELAESSTEDKQPKQQALVDRRRRMF